MFRTSRLLALILLVATVGCESQSPTRYSPPPEPTPSPVSTPSSRILPIEGQFVPTPSISSVSPAVFVAGSGDVTVTITGSGFGHFPNHIYSFVLWWANGTETWLSAQIVSDTLMTAIVKADLIAAPGSARMGVVNGDGMGWSDGNTAYPTSNVASLVITLR